MRITKIIALSSLLILMSSCGRTGTGTVSTPGTPPSNPNGNTTPATGAARSLDIDPQLVTYYNAFVSEAAAENYSLNIEMLSLVMDSTLNNVTAASCSGTQVSINPTFWTQLNENQKQNIVFHELGKCVLNRADRNSLNNGLPLSVMNSSLVPSSAYAANYSQYMYELFNKQDLNSQLPLHTN
jgi:hypothetical protein